MRFRQRKKKPNWSKTICCLLKADKDAGNPLLKMTVLFLCQKLGVKIPDVIEVDKTPKRLITARRV